MKKISYYLYTLILSLTISGAFAKTNFIITSDTPHIQIIDGKITTITYNVLNNQSLFIDKIGFTELPAGVTHIPDGNPGSCTHPFDLNANGTPGDNCNAQLYIDTTQMKGTPPFTYAKGPKVCHEYNNPMRCSKPATDAQTLHIQVVPPDSPLLPVLELILPSGECDADSNCYIVREITNTELVVQLKNTGPSDALNVEVNIGDLDLASVSPTTCAKIPANGGICTVTFTAKPVGSTSGLVTFNGMNVAVPLGFHLTVQEHGISIGPLVFTAPGNQTLTLTNLTTLTTNINSLTFSGNIYGVTNVTNCTVIPPGIGATCTTPATYNAQVNAYGSGTITANYGYTGGDAPGPFDITNVVSVDTVTAVINDNLPITFDYEENEKLVSIANTGAFGLQNPLFSLTKPDPDIPLDVTNSHSDDPCPNPIPPGTSCNAELIRTGDLSDDESKILTFNLNGTNLHPSPTSKNIQIEQGLSIAKVISGNNIVGGLGTHLQYQAFAVGNTIEDDVILDDITVAVDAAFAGKIGVCTPTPAGTNTTAVTNCDGYNNPGVGQTPMCVEGETLSENEMCVIWIKSLDDKKGLSSTSVDDVGLEITVEFNIQETPPHPYILTQNFTLKHAISLFAGGSFTTVPSLGIGKQRVVRWTGNTSPLAWIDMETSGFSDTPVEVLQIYKGDLYAAGEFTISTPVSSRAIGRWDGTTWHRPGGAAGGINGSFPLNQRVQDMIVKDDLLYLTGQFTSIANGTTASTANYVATWDGSLWQPVPASGTQLPAIYNRGLSAASFQNNFCIALRHSSVAMPLGDVRCFDGSSWSGALGSQTFTTLTIATLATVRTVANDPNSEVLYLAGEYVTAASTSASLMKYFGSAWGDVVDTASHRTTGIKRTVQAMPPTMAGSDVNPGFYLGGVFNNTTGGTPPNIELNRIAGLSVNSLSNPASLWLPLQNSGTNMDVGINVLQGNAVAYSLAYGYPTSTMAGSVPTIVYVGGIFTTVADGTIAVGNGAYWDSAAAGPPKWHAIPSTQANTIILALLVAPGLCVKDEVTTCPNF